MTNCQMCSVKGEKNVPAYASAKFVSVGSWFYVCAQCFKDYHCELGDGMGRELAEEGQSAALSTGFNRAPLGLPLDVDVRIVDHPAAALGTCPSRRAATVAPGYGQRRRARRVRR